MTRHSHYEQASPPPLSQHRARPGYRGQKTTMCVTQAAYKLGLIFLFFLRECCSVFVTIFFHFTALLRQHGFPTKLDAQDVC